MKLISSFKVGGGSAFIGFCSGKSFLVIILQYNFVFNNKYMSSEWVGQVTYTLKTTILFPTQKFMVSLYSMSLHGPWPHSCVIKGRQRFQEINVAPHSTFTWVLVDKDLQIELNIHNILYSSFLKFKTHDSLFPAS